MYVVYEIFDTHTHTHTHMYIYMCVCVCMCAWVRAFVCVCVCMHNFLCIYTTFESFVLKLRMNGEMSCCNYPIYNFKTEFANEKEIQRERERGYERLREN